MTRIQSHGIGIVGAGEIVEYGHLPADFQGRLPVRKTGKWTTVSDRECWMPDAFAGPVIGLIEAIEHNTEPPTSGADNLSTLRLVESLYASSELRSTVNPNDIH